MHVTQSLKEIIQTLLISLCRAEIESRLSVPPFSGAFVAVRSSGTDEDSAAHSFAGLLHTKCLARSRLVLDWLLWKVW